MKILVNNLDEKHILLYSSDSKVEDLILANNWSGEVKNSPKDYLMVTNGNISGTKTSLKTIEDIKLNVNIFSDGSIIDNVDITHNGRNLTGGLLETSDKSFIEIFTPLNSELISVQYDEKEISLDQIYQFQESDKTVFAFKGLQIAPGEIKKLSFKYKLPFKIGQNDFYSLYLQKQLNSNNNNVITQINLPTNLKVKNSEPSDIKIDPNFVEFITNLETDRYLKLDF